MNASRPSKPDQVQKLQATVIAWGPRGEKITDITMGDLDVNAWLISEGHGWVLRKWLHRPELLELEAEARAAGKGIWALESYQEAFKNMNEQP